MVGDRIAIEVEVIAAHALHRQVRSHFGAELTFLMADVSTNGVHGVLYDAVAFQCGFDEPTGAFGSAIAIGDGRWTSTVFGEPGAYLERFAAGVENRDSESAT